MNTDGQRRALREAEPPIDDEIALAVQEFERLFRSADYVEPVFLRPYLIEGLRRIARAGTPRDVGYREIHELLPLLLALIDLVGRLPEELRGGWALGNFVLPADMTVEHLCNQGHQLELTLREASGQLAALLRPITHLAADAPLLEQMRRMPQYLPTARDPHIPDRAN